MGSSAKKKKEKKKDFQVWDQSDCCMLLKKILTKCSLEIQAEGRENPPQRDQFHRY